MGTNRNGNLPEVKVKTLMPKQELFVQAYCSNGFNATNAAETAGYRGNRRTLQAIGGENLSKPMIKEAIQAKRAEKAEKINITEEWVIENLKKVYNRAMKTDRLSDANKDLELLGKNLGMYKDKIDVNMFGGERPPDNLAQAAIQASKDRVKMVESMVKETVNDNSV